MLAPKESYYIMKIQKQVSDSQPVGKLRQMQ